MVNLQRANLLDSQSPNPSVETLLHAFLPHKFVDHTHATPFLILANLPNYKKIVDEIFGSKLAVVPYIMPGFDLAKKVADKVGSAFSKLEDLSGDGEVTQKDVLIGRGVINKDGSKKS